MSRYQMDYELYKLATSIGVKVIHEQVLSTKFNKDQFSVQTKGSGVFYSQFVIGAFGKRSNLDVEMQRKFVSGIDCSGKYRKIC